MEHTANFHTNYGYLGARRILLDLGALSADPDLARRARMTKQGMMLLVDDLETRGYVRRVPDADDSRAKMVRLTARGRRFVAEARRAVAAVEARARRELGDRRYEALRDSLEFLVGGGEGWFEEA